MSARGRAAHRWIAATRRREDAVALALMALGFLVLLAPALVGGGVLIGTGHLYDLLPWSTARPPGVEANGLLSDAAVDFWPWLDHARDALRSGDFPGWNPYVLAGTPFAANAQTALFAPFSVPFWVLPFGLAFGVSAFLKLLAAAFGAYLLARRLGCGLLPGLVAACAFAGCSYVTVWFNHPHAGVVVLLPWLLLAAERCRARPGARSAALVATALALIMLGGHPGTQVHAGVGLVIWWVVRAVAEPEPQLGRATAWLVGGLVVGAAAAAPAWVPPTLLVPGSVGLAAREGAEVLPWRTLVTLVAPGWWGDPTTALFGGPSNYAERTTFAGSAALVLGALALARPRRAAAPLALVVLSLAAAVGVAPLSTINGDLPPLSQVAGQRIVLLAQLGIALLGALGLQELLARERARRWTLAVLGVTAVVALAVLASVTLRGPQGTDLADVLGAIRERRPTWQLLRFVGVAKVALAVLAIAAVALLGRRLPTVARGGIVVAVVLVEMLTFMRGYTPVVPRAAAFPPPTGLLRALQERTGTRMTMVSSRFSLLPDSAMPYGLRDLRGHDPPEPDAAYGRILTRIGAAASGLQFPALNTDSARGLALLGVDEVALDAGDPEPVPSTWTRSYAGADGVLYDVPDARPRTFVPTRVAVAADPAAALQEMFAGATDPGDQVVAATRLPAGAGTVTRPDDRGDEVRFTATMRAAGVVVLTDRIAKGWTVEVDERPARARTIDTVLRGVVVPAGRHEVRWRYAVPGLRASVAVSAFALLCLLALALGGPLSAARRSRRGSRAGRPRTRR